MYVPLKEPDLSLNWCSLIINPVHLDKCINLSDLHFFMQEMRNCEDEMRK